MKHIEAMKLALGKIKSARDCHPNAVNTLLFEAEEILEESLEKPDFWDGYVPEPDNTCSNALREQGKAYPRTCKKCGLGPCVELAQQALNKKAENAREQPAQKCSYPYCGCNSKAWCKVERNEALDKKAENARELGLDYEQPSHKFHLTQQQDPEWKCYLFGNKPETGSYGIVYIPSVGNVPNWFIRWMMKVCLGCTWVREQK